MMGSKNMLRSGPKSKWAHCYSGNADFLFAQGETFINDAIKTSTVFINEFTFCASCNMMEKLLNIFNTNYTCFSGFVAASPHFFIRAERNKKQINDPSNRLPKKSVAKGRELCGSNCKITRIKILEVIFVSCPMSNDATVEKSVYDLFFGSIKGRHVMCSIVRVINARCDVTPQQAVRTVDPRQRK